MILFCLHMSLHQIQKYSRPIFRLHGVAKAAVFGSVARKQARHRSDIDFLVQFDHGASLIELIGLQQELEKKLKKKCDVVTYGSLHPALKKRILAEQHIIYEKRS